MLFKITVKAPKGASVKRIERLAEKLGDRTHLMQRIGKTFEKGLRRHFQTLNRRPNKRGWKRIGFWNGIAKSVSFVGADRTSATVAVQDGRKFAAKVFGARITPKAGKKFLAIPAIESRYGISPSAADDRDVLQFRRTRRGGILGVVRSDGSMQVHYWLVRKATIPRDPDALPKPADILPAVKQTISRYLKS